MITWLRTSVPALISLRPLAVASAAVSACLSWLEWLAWLPRSVHAVDGGGPSTPIALSLSAVLCALALRRAQRTPSEQWLWLGVMWSCALLSPCVLLLTTPAAGIDLGHPAAAVAVVSVVVATYLVQHAGVHAWRLQASLHADSTTTPSTTSTTNTTGASPALSGPLARRRRTVDRHEVLMGLAAVLVTVALLNAGFVFVPSTLLEQVPRWQAWGVLQVPLTVIAVCAVRAQALLVVAHARRVLADLRIWLMAASAVGTVLIGVGAAARILEGAAVSGLPHPSLLAGAAGALLTAPLPLLLLVIAAWLPPRTPRRGPASFDNAATLGAFAILVVAVAVLTAAALGYAAASDLHTLAPAHLAPYGLTAAALSCAAALLGATRLLLNVRHLAWFTASQREALTDELTGLSNRRGLLRALEEATASGAAVGLALLDLDRFKEVNDALGHAAGDALLRQVATRLASMPPAGPYEARRVLARLGGDEFVVLIVAQTHLVPQQVLEHPHATARAWGQHLVALFEAPFDLGGARVHVRASAGTTFRPAAVDPSTTTPAGASGLGTRGLWGRVRGQLSTFTTRGAIPNASTGITHDAFPDISADGAMRLRGVADSQTNRSRAVHPMMSPASELLRRVDAAMYDAKAAAQVGTSDQARSVVYDPARHDGTGSRLELAEDLRSALSRDTSTDPNTVTGSIEVHFQPQLHTGDGHLAGLEALVRWQHPVHGAVNPEHLVAVAEAYGLMDDLTDYVLDRAVAQAAWWTFGPTPLWSAAPAGAVSDSSPHLTASVSPDVSTGVPTDIAADAPAHVTAHIPAHGANHRAHHGADHGADHRMAAGDAGLPQLPGPQWRMSVNLSASSLLDADLPERIEAVLRRHGLPAHLLVLEVTESVLVADVQRSVAVLERLALLGVEVSIDDFGTGYSSLTQLATLPAQEVKLDRAFTQALGTQARTEAVVQAAVTLAHRLGMRVVAEGVEDQAALAHLRALGCDVTQGWLHAPALPADQVLPWCAARGLQAPRDGQEPGRQVAPVKHLPSTC